MAKFTNETIDRVRDAADIVEIVSAHTDLRRAGQRFTGLCPFHEERTPSFSVNAAEKLYYCFGCEAKGDVFRFVEEKEGLSFPDAVESLAERYGVEIERVAEDPREEARRRRRGRLYEALERTAAFYVSYLWDSPKAAKAREYLEGRGLGEEVLRAFGVGFAPSAWDQVLTRGQRAGFKVDELRAAGLIQKGKGDGFYDRFRARIMFPIRDRRGRVIGFGARDLRPDAKPKYLNSPEGELYRKSETLYGIERARGPIAKAGRAIVVEGYTDVLALHQAGVENAVAISGTAITPDQLNSLASYLGTSSTVVFALDADSAGSKAMVRAFGVASKKQLDLKVASMPEGRDPADLLQAGDVDQFHALVDGATDVRAFKVQVELNRGDLSTPAGRERVLREVAPWVRLMGESVGRDELERQVADRLDTAPSLVRERVRSAGPPSEGAPDRGRPPGSDGGAEGQGSGDRADEPRRALTPRELRERALLAMCIGEPKKGREFLERLSDEHLTPSAAKARQWLAGHLDSPTAGLPREDEELVSMITELVVRAEREPAEERAMELNFMLLEQQLLEERIAEARTAGDYERGATLSRERAALTDRIAGVG